MSPINAYLIFDGTAGEAMQFYQRTLGGKLDKMMHFGDMPPTEGCPPSVPSDRVLHACLMLDDGLLMASDTMPGQPYEGMKGFGIALSYPTVAEATRVFNALADGGQVTMPQARTFWVECFGMVTDRFGTPWLINGGAVTA